MGLSCLGTRPVNPRSASLYHSKKQSARMTSVFVGNIPYGVTEEQLKDIFGEAGSVVSFRIVHDRETGRSKGFGFCEYQDPSSAQNAMRDLNGYELNGRTLRVDTANRR